MNVQTPGLQTTLIGNKKVTMATIPARKAIGFEARIAVLLAGAAATADWKKLTSLADGVGEGSDIATILENGGQDAISSIAAAVSSVDPDKFADLVVDLCANTFVDGVSGEDFDNAFAESGLAVKVAMWVAQETFGAFIKGLIPSSSEDQAETTTGTLQT